MSKIFVCAFALVLCMACGRDESLGGAGGSGGNGGASAAAPDNTDFLAQNDPAGYAGAPGAASYADFVTDWDWAKKGIATPYRGVTGARKAITRTSPEFDAVTDGTYRFNTGYLEYP